MLIAVVYGFANYEHSARGAVQWCWYQALPCRSACYNPRMSRKHDEPDRGKATNRPPSATAAPSGATYEPSPLPGLPASLLDLDALRSAVESLLFIAGRPMELAELRKLLAVEDKRLREAIRALEIACEEHGRGIRVQRLGEQVQLVSAPENARFVATYLGMPSQVKLTNAALETLSVIAYRQPVTRAQLEAVRGVNSDRALASLLQYGLVIEVGRAATVGRPVLFATSGEFLQQFGLGSLDALPVPEMPEAALIEANREAAARRIRGAIGVGDEGGDDRVVLDRAAAPASESPNDDDRIEG
jgi:segregation and condensation protein B